MKKISHKCEGTSCLCTRCKNDVKDCCGNRKHKYIPCPIRSCGEFKDEGGDCGNVNGELPF